MHISLRRAVVRIDLLYLLLCSIFISPTRLNKTIRLTCNDLRLDPLFDLDNIGGLRFVAPRPASKLFNNDGLLAQINAWNDETVKTPSLFRVFLVALETCVNNDCKEITMNNRLRIHQPIYWLT